MDSDTSDTSIEDRVRPVETGIRYSCEDCNAKFKRKDTLLRHRRTQHDDFRNGQQKHRCPFEDCDVEVGRRDHLRRHIVLVHKAEPWEILPQPDRRKRNSRTGSGSEDKERFKCVFVSCNTELSRIDHLKRHVKIVHKQDPAQFPELERKKRESGVRRSSGAGGSSNSKGRKESLKGKKEEGEKERFKCVVAGCDTELSRMDHLRRHVKVVHKQDPAQVPGLERKKRESGGRISGGRRSSKSRERKKGPKVMKKEDEDDGQVEGQDDTGNLEEMEGTIINEVNDEDPVLCILCTSFYIPSAKMGGAETLNELVHQVVGNRGGGGRFRSSSSNVKTAKVERLSVCPQCRQLARSVTEKRLEVRRLRLQILKETRKLENRVAEYGVEWRKLKGLVNQSDVDSLDKWLERNEREGKTEDNSLVFCLREGILCGGENPLARSHKDLERKLCYSQDDLIEIHDADEYPECSGSKRMSIARAGTSQRKAKKLKKVTPTSQPEQVPSIYSKAPDVVQDEECGDDYDSNPCPVEAVNEDDGDDVGPQNDDNGQQENAADEDEDADEVFEFYVGAEEMPECEQEEDATAEPITASENEVVNEKEKRSKRKRKSEAKRKNEWSKSAPGKKEKGGRVGKKKKDAIVKLGTDTCKSSTLKRKQLRKREKESRKQKQNEPEPGAEPHQKHSCFNPGEDQITHSDDRPSWCFIKLTSVDKATNCQVFY